ncbi:hypothetical protein SNEBB_002548 [Seison nebaliae]|nr:hypothetical protein SNEBB_002548 [Seison nebaliae]
MVADNNANRNEELIYGNYESPLLRLRHQKEKNVNDSWDVFSVGIRENSKLIEKLKDETVYQYPLMIDNDDVNDDNGNKVDNVLHLEYKKIRHRRYTTKNRIWLMKDITWKIEKFTDDLDPTDVNTTFHIAFSLWGEHIPRNFIYSDTNPIIKIRFEKFAHAPCNDPFDGFGGILGHSYPPSSKNRGYIHLDDSELWTIKNPEGADLLFTAVHEIGHALGLKHFPVPRANNVMIKYLTQHSRGYVRLGTADIGAIQFLYGSRSSTKLSNVEDNMQTSDDGIKAEIVPLARSICSGKVDAVFSLTKNLVVFFIGSYIMKLDEHGIFPKYPKHINKVFRHIDGTIDAALFLTTLEFGHQIYLFKNEYFYTYDYNVKTRRCKPAENFQRKLSQFGMRNSQKSNGCPFRKIDAAFQRKRQIYFISNNDYYIFNYGEIGGGRTSSSTPTKIPFADMLNGENINAALQWNGEHIFLFFDTSYVKYSVRNQVLVDLSKYPKSTKKVWIFNCISRYYANQIIRH